MAWKECVICGNGFDAKAHNSKYCKSPCSAQTAFRLNPNNKDKLRESRDRWYSKNRDTILRKIKTKEALEANRLAVARRRARNRVPCFRDCVICGLSFDRTAPSQKTCSKKCSSALEARKMVRVELEKQFGFSPPPDLVEEAFALRMLNRALKE
jgi:predicted nucleic acid-binding Zn ribbon protein